MNDLTKTLLGGVALSALTVVQAVAGDAPHLHVVALHAGRVVNKTKMHDQKRDRITYTFGVSTSVPASDLNKTVKLTQTFWKWNSRTDCSNPRQKIKAPKKSLYGKVEGVTETYSLGCSSGPTIFYGDTYKLKDPAGFGKTDSFVSILYAWYRWENQGPKYKGTLYFDVTVPIGN